MFKIIATVGGIQVLAILINLIRTKVIAVLLGPEGVGVISIVDQVVQSAAYFSALSIPFAAVKFLSRAHSEGAAAFRVSYGSFLKGLLILATAGTIVTLGVVMSGSSWLGSQVSQYRAYLAIACMGIPAMVLGGFFVNVLAAAQRSRASAVMAIVTNATFTTAAVAGLYAGGIPALYISTVVAGVLLTIGTLAYLRRTLGLAVHDKAASPLGELRRSPAILSFTAMQYFATATFSASLLVARYSVLERLGETEAGLLQATISIALAVGLVLNPTNGLFLTPMVNRNTANADKASGAAEFHRKLVLVLSVAVMPLLLFPDVVLTVLFSSRFTGASQIVFLFVVWQCVVQLAGVYQALLIGFDDLKGYAAITCAGHLGSATLCWFLVPHYGILGVSLGFVLSNFAIFLLTLGRLRLKYSVPLTASLGWLTVYSLAGLTIGGFLFGRFPDASAATVLVKVFCYGGFALSLLFFLTEQERNSLYSFCARMRIGNARVG